MAFLLPVVVALVSLAGAARPTCDEYTNCWSCSGAPLCAWCGSQARCQLYSNVSACPFTLWKGTCCRTITPRGCEACIREAGCGFCLDQGCFEGTPSGPDSSSCPNWFFETCYAPAVIVDFTGTSVVFGLTATIGGGLMLACVSVLIFFLRRLCLRWRAARQFDAYLATHRHSCAVCEDMVASLCCLTCEKVLCAACGEESWCGKRGARQRHVTTAVEEKKTSAVTVGGARSDEHYESFARLRPARNLNFDDMD